MENFSNIEYNMDYENENPFREAQESQEREQMRADREDREMNNQRYDD